MNTTSTIKLTKDMLSDRELVFLVKNGDATAFTVLSDRFMPLVAGRASRYSGLVGVDIEDFLQEGLLALYRAVLGFAIDSPTRFSTYAIACVQNAMADCIKSHMKLSHQNTNMCIDDIDEDKFLQAPAQKNFVEDIYFGREDFKVRSQKIETLLSDFEQQVLKLYLGCYSYQQIADYLSTTTKAVDNALQRIRRKLRPAED